MSFELPALPYDSHLLEPRLAKSWIEHRYMGDHLDHLRVLNRWAAVQGQAALSLDDGLRAASEEVRHHAQEAWNLTLFWHCLTPRPEPLVEPLATMIQRQYGSVEGMKEACIRILGKAGESAAWVWVLRQDDSLVIATTGTGEPMTTAGEPLLVLDVLGDSEALERLWPLINWPFAARNAQD
ncbi:hypothetical protein KUV86_00470 [Halomonas sp. DP8Y7-3]|uniref:Fe-Mn family superoxide dismutase n=1 Tax=Halomonas sp. DP8Y7-3 TaxID=2859079 RepID=UPI001C983F63|nr:Fe-Mn family superoxide dismutase [Halomonas sp. DP8Y7-3]MBY5927583.1 hypothetical protein [Halomonas sp. DP8Y7-3]